MAEVEEIERRIEKLLENANDMKLNHLDSITITDAMSVLKTRFSRVMAGLEERISRSRNLLEKCNVSRCKANETLELIRKTEERLKELNRPVGRNVEDVYERIAAYQVCVL